MSRPVLRLPGDSGHNGGLNIARVKANVGHHHQMHRSNHLPRVGEKSKAFGLYALDMLKVLDGTPCPEETDVDGVNAWKKANNNIYSILYFHTESSADTVRALESTEVGCLGDGVAALKALKERFDGNLKEARRACQEKLFTTTMPSGGDPTDFTSTMDMGEKILDDT